MKTVIRHTFLLFIFSFLFVGNIFGQYDADAVPYDSLGMEKRKKMSIDYLDKLKAGTLIVRLGTKSEKLKTIEGLLNSEEVEPSSKKRLEKLKNTEITTTEKKNQKIVKSIEKYYAFSKALILYDTSIHRLYSGETSGFFLNNDLTVDPNIKINEGDYFILDFGKEFNSPTVSPVEGYSISDHKGNYLPYPFPYFFPVAKNIFPALYGQKYFDTIAKKMNYRLQKFEAKILMWEYKEEAEKLKDY